MENKPIHYDGSVSLNDEVTKDSYLQNDFELTNDMRTNISGNPYIFE
ncbi:hypothetical protein [Gottfriedia luciferensis]|nr:hypothetical protein [Gottfriedia luciferensis]